MARPSQHQVNYINAGDMSSDVTGTSQDTEFQEVLSFQFVWTGTPTGTIDIELSNDGSTWTPAGLSGSDPAGSAGNAILEIETASKYARAVYSSTSGSGSLSVHYSAKSLG